MITTIVFIYKLVFVLVCWCFRHF